MAINFNKDTRFLFVGDSVTEGGRTTDPGGIGDSYVRITRDLLRARHPPTAPIVINRGAANLRLSELAARWSQDVIAERPDLISILIGVNDATSGPQTSTAGASIAQFATIYRHILTRTAEHLPRCTLVLCEPAALWSATSVHADENLRPYMHTLTEIAREFKAYCIVPLHSAFVYARRARPDIAWVRDDGQPTSSGHALIAHTWMEETGILPRPVS